MNIIYYIYSTLFIDYLIHYCKVCSLCSLAAGDTVEADFNLHEIAQTAETKIDKQR